MRKIKVVAEFKINGFNLVVDKPNSYYRLFVKIDGEDIALDKRTTPFNKKIVRLRLNQFLAKK